MIRSSWPLSFMKKRLMGTTSLYPSEAVLVMRMEGSNGGTNFTDESSYARSITRSGTPTISTSRFLEGGSSALFASGDYLTSADSEDFNFGSGAWCVFAWVYKTNSGYAFIVGQRDSDPHWGLAHTSGGTPEYIIYLNGGGGVSGSGGRQILNEWVHYALSRNASGVYRLRQNGKVVHTSTDNRALATISYALKIGRSGIATDSGLPLTGNIDALAILKGLDLFDTNDSILMPTTLVDTPQFFVSPKIDASGGRAVGNTVTCSSGTAWPNAGSYSYQWKLAGTPISGATSSSYTIQSGDDVTTLSCTVTNGAASETVTLGHRYWRINVTAINGGAACGISEVEMYAKTTKGNECYGGTASASSEWSGSDAAAEAFNGVFGSGSDAWASASGGAMPQWLKYDFGTTSFPNVTRVCISARGSVDTGQAPKDFNVQWSDDNSSWTTAWSVTNSTGWSAFERRTFDKP